MQDWVIDDDNLSPERKSLLPGKGFFVPDDVHQEAKEAEIEDRVSGAETVAVVDPDADGLACVAILRDVLGEVAFVPASPHDLAEGIERAAEFGADGGDVYICDLAPDEPDTIEGPLEQLLDAADSVTWYDHHQWTKEAMEAVRAAGVDLVVGDSDEECTADVAARSLEGELSPHLEELAAVTRDHDLWIKEDDRSDDLADLSQWKDPEEYLEVIEDHGVDFPEAVQEFLAEKRVEKEDRIERAVSRAELREIRDWTVGITYGRCSQNEVAEALREQGADAAVIVKPAGSASIRGSEDFERAHEVARQVGGGGHPKAAGCKPRIYEDMLDYANHWTTRGEPAKQLIMKAFWNLDEEPAEE